MNLKFGRKCVFCMERSSLGHQVRIRRGWCRWIHRAPQGDHLIYMQEIVAFVLYRSEHQVWSKMCVSSGEVFSGPSSPRKAMVVSLDSQNPAGGPFDIGKKLSRLSYIEMYFMFGRKCVFRLERSSLGHQVRIRGVWCH